MTDTDTLIAKGSPFKSDSLAVRQAGADQMIEIRKYQIARREALLKKSIQNGVKATTINHLKTAINGAKGSLGDWIGYKADGCPIVPGATEIPGITS